LSHLNPLKDVYVDAVQAELRLWDLDNLKLSDPKVYDEIWDYIERKINFEELETGYISYNVIWEDDKLSDES